MEDATRITMEHADAVTNLAEGFAVLIILGQHAIDAHDAPCVGQGIVMWVDTFIGFARDAGWIAEDDIRVILDVIDPSE